MTETKAKHAREIRFPTADQLLETGRSKRQGKKTQATAKNRGTISMLIGTDSIGLYPRLQHPGETEAWSTFPELSLKAPMLVLLLEHDMRVDEPPTPRGIPFSLEGWIVCHLRPGFPKRRRTGGGGGTREARATCFVRRMETARGEEICHEIQHIYTRGLG